MAQTVKAILLCRLRMEDCIVWPRTRDGNYSVKTGYQLPVESENRGVASGSNNDNLRSFWKGIWKMRIPNKIKNFVGVLALSPSQLWRTYIGVRWSPLLCAVAVEQTEKRFFMRSGSVTKSRLAGVVPS